MSLKKGKKKGDVNTFVRSFRLLEAERLNRCEAMKSKKLQDYLERQKSVVSWGIDREKIKTKNTITGVQKSSGCSQHGEAPRGTDDTDYLDSKYFENEPPVSVTAWHQEEKEIQKMLHLEMMTGMLEAPWKRLNINGAGEAFRSVHDLPGYDSDEDLEVQAFLHHGTAADAIKQRRQTARTELLESIKKWKNIKRRREEIGDVFEILGKDLKEMRKKTMKENDKVVSTKTPVSGKFSVREWERSMMKEYATSLAREPQPQVVLYKTENSDKENTEDDDSTVPSFKTQWKKGHVPFKEYRTTMGASVFSMQKGKKGKGRQARVVFKDTDLGEKHPEPENQPMVTFYETDETLIESSPDEEEATSSKLEDIFDALEFGYEDGKVKKKSEEPLRKVSTEQSIRSHQISPQSSKTSTTLSPGSSRLTSGSTTSSTGTNLSSQDVISPSNDGHSIDGISSVSSLNNNSSIESAECSSTIPTFSSEKESDYSSSQVSRNRVSFASHVDIRHQAHHKLLRHIPNSVHNRPWALKPKKDWSAYSVHMPSSRSKHLLSSCSEHKIVEIEKDEQGVYVVQKNKKNPIRPHSATNIQKSNTDSKKANYPRPHSAAITQKSNFNNNAKNKGEIGKNTSRPPERAPPKIVSNNNSDQLNCKDVGKMYHSKMINGSRGNTNQNCVSDSVQSPGVTAKNKPLKSSMSGKTRPKSAPAINVQGARKDFISQSESNNNTVKKIAWVDEVRLKNSEKDEVDADSDDADVSQYPPMYMEANRLPQWRRELLHEAPPGMQTQRSPVKVNIVLSKKQRMEELDKLVEEHAGDKRTLVRREQARKQLSRYEMLLKAQKMNEAVERMKELKT